MYVKIVMGELSSKKGSSSSPSRTADGHPRLSDNVDRQWLRDGEDRSNGRLVVAFDATLLLVQYIQLFAVLQSSSAVWPVASSWITFGKFLFLANVDVWAYLTFSNDQAVSVYSDQYHVPSRLVPASYVALLVSWSSVIFVALLVFGIWYSALRWKSMPALHRRHVAAVRRNLTFVIQLVVLPIGVFFMRLFQCTPDGVMVVDGDRRCHGGAYVLYSAVSLVVFAVLFVVLPAWFVVRTRIELTRSWGEHYDYLLKTSELTYRLHVDDRWLLGGFFVFASFRRSAVHFRAVQVAAFGLLLVVCAAFHSYPYVLTYLVFLLFGSMLFGCALLRPFRVAACNWMLVANYLALSATSLFHCLRRTFFWDDVTSDHGPQLAILATINALWLVGAVVFVVYLITTSCCSQNRWRSPWPRITFSELDSDSLKYIETIVTARMLISKIKSGRSVDADVEATAYYIRVLNSYCGEAERTNNELLGSLWNVIDELVAVYILTDPRCLLISESMRRSNDNEAAAAIVEMMQTAPEKYKDDFGQHELRVEEDGLSTRQSLGGSTDPTSGRASKVPGRLVPVAFQPHKLHSDVINPVYSKSDPSMGIDKWMAKHGMIALAINEDTSKRQYDKHGQTSGPLLGRAVSAMSAPRSRRRLGSRPNSGITLSAGAVFSFMRPADTSTHVTTSSGSRQNVASVRQDSGPNEPPSRPLEGRTDTNLMESLLDRSKTTVQSLTPENAACCCQ